MRVRDVMTRGVETIRPEATLQDAARCMAEMNIGSLPVADGGRVYGIVTDRDITVRATAQGLDPCTTPVHTIMTPEVKWCFEDQDVLGAGRLMEEYQIRRLLVLNREKQLSGMVSLGDLAVKMHEEAMVGEMLEEISEPAQPVRAAA